tara:strand:- start:330 stop:2210 length:1881 start_codon:yes stop_codon:yes gene_type:complete
MSFMAGFADGFVDERNRIIKKDEEDERDMFNLTYKSFLDRREKNEAQAQKDKQAAATAEAIAQRYNQPVAPILSALRSGTDTSLVTDMAKSGAWEPVEGTEQPDQVDPVGATDPTQPPADATVVGPMFEDVTKQKGFTKSVQRIAEIEGRSPDQVVSELNPRSAPAGPGGSYTYKARPEEKSFDPNVIRQQAMEMQQKLARGEITQPEFDLWKRQNVDPAIAAESMFDKPTRDELPTSPEGMAAMIAEAQASGDPVRIKKAQDMEKIYSGLLLRRKQAEGEFGTSKLSLVRDSETGEVREALLISEVGPDGERTFRDMSDPRSPPIDPNQVYEVPDAVKDIGTEILAQSQSKPVLEYKDKMVQATSGIRIAGDLMDMVNTDKNLVADVSSGLALSANNVIKEFSAFGSLFEKAANGEEVSLSPDQVEQFERDIAGVDPNAIQDRAAKYALFRAKTLLYIYRMGAVEGQEGRALTEADVQRLETMLGATSDVNSYKENLVEYTQSNIDMLDDSARMMSQFNAPYKRYKDITGFVPYDMPAPTLEQFIASSGDTELQKTYQNIKDAQVTNPSQQAMTLQQARANQAQAPAGPTTIPPQAVDMLRNNPELAPMFDEKYGAGASEQYLRN